MRKLVLLAFAVPLLLAPPALAGSDAARQRPGTESVCRVPDISLEYDTQYFSAHVSLPASGCHSREHTQFVLSVSISRLDNSGGRDFIDRSAMCGPFRSTDDFESGEEAPQYFCDMAVALDHPEVETAQYDVEVSYPGAAAQRVDKVFTFCTSDGKTASCEQ